MSFTAPISELTGFKIGPPAGKQKSASSVKGKGKKKVTDEYEEQSSSSSSEDDEEEEDDEEDHSRGPRVYHNLYGAPKALPSQARFK